MSSARWAKDLVRVCEADPDLVARLPRRDAEAARCDALAEAVVVRPAQPLPLFAAISAKHKGSTGEFIPWNRTGALF